MEHNMAPISLKEGKVFIDGIEIFDEVACSITFTPQVWSGSQVGERSPSSRWLGYTISGSITRRRTTNWLKNTIMGYLRTGRTPELTIQGIMNDSGSDFFQEHGSDTITATGCVLTGDLNLLMHDAAGQVLDDVIAFNAKGVV